MVLSRHDGSGVSDGDPRIRVGCSVNVAAVGSLFNGSYYVSGVRHLYDGNRGYRTEDCPNAACEAEELVSLPMFHGMSDADADHVVAAVRKVVAHFLAAG